MSVCPSLLAFTALFGHQVQNNFFALIKKIFLQTLVETIFRYHKFCLGFWDPLGPPYEHNEFFSLGVLGCPQDVFGVRGGSSWWNLYHLLKN